MVGWCYKAATRLSRHAATAVFCVLLTLYVFILLSPLFTFSTLQNGMLHLTYKHLNVTARWGFITLDFFDIRQTFLLDAKREGWGPAVSSVSTLHIFQACLTVLFLFCSCLRLLSGNTHNHVQWWDSSELLERAVRLSFFSCMMNSFEAVLTKAKLVSLGCANSCQGRRSVVSDIIVVACILGVFHVSPFIISNSQATVLHVAWICSQRSRNTL